MWLDGPLDAGGAAAGDGRHGRAPRVAADEDRRPRRRAGAGRRRYRHGADRAHRAPGGAGRRRAHPAGRVDRRRPREPAVRPGRRAADPGRADRRRARPAPVGAGHAPHHQRRRVHEDPDGRVVRAVPGRDGRRARRRLPPLWMEYGDYAVWQHDLVRGEELDRQLGYWRGQLRGAPPILALPADRPRPARQSSRGATATVTIDAATTRRLAEVALDTNATMFMLFLAGFAAVLSRYTRQSDIVIGTQVAGRTHAELDPIVGLFTNTVPLRISLAGRSDLRRVARPGQGHHPGRAVAPADPVREARRGVRAGPHARARRRSSRSSSSTDRSRRQRWTFPVSPRTPGRCSPGPRNSTSPCTRTPRAARDTTLVMEYSTDLLRRRRGRTGSWAAWRSCSGTRRTLPAPRWPTCRCCPRRRRMR